MDRSFEFVFEPRVAAQAAAHVVKKNGGEIDVFHLVKALYLAERESLKERNRPIFGDRYASLEHGPVVSGILDLARGRDVAGAEYWKPHLERDGNAVRVASDPGDDDLNGADIAFLDKAYEMVKGRDFRELREWCHTLPEWSDPGRSMRPIPVVALLEKLGKDPRSINALEIATAKWRELDALFSSE